MSSWKQYGGTNKSEKSNDIKADSIIVNNLSITKPYQGNLVVNGSLQITKDLLISGNTQMVGNTVFDNILVSGISNFNGIAIFNSDFAIQGNIDSKSNVNVENNIICGNVIYFNKNSQFIHADPSGVSINKMNPNAALDISTNLVNGIVIQSSQPVSTSTLIQNNDNQGILLYGNTTVEYIDFFNETALSSESVGDARLSYTKGGIFEIDVSQNINLMSNVTISNRGSQPHLFNETVIIYDTSNGSFFGNIYSEPITSGSALTLVSSNNNSNTFLHISTPSGEGLAIGGGVYSNDISRSSAFIGLTDSSGQLSNSTIIVSSSDPVKYRSTIGINTFQPQTEKYVVDINGPIHIDNADITIIDQQIPFEIYSMSISKNYRNKIIALGSSYDITIANGFSNYRERIIISNDYGSRWQQINISNSLLSLKADQLTNIFTYDNSYAFISGTKNTLFFSIDGGYNWNNIITNITINQSFNNIHIGNSTISGNNILYFSSGNNLYYYDFSLNNLNLETESIIVNIIVTSLVNINSITTNSNAIFLAGSTIVKYNTSNFSLPPTSHSNTSNISYNEIHSYNNTIIAVGNGIISSSRNNGSSWTDIYQNGIQFNSIFCNDELNCIAVGNNGNVWISQDGGINWEFLYDSVLNPSGKKLLVTDPSNILQNVVMSDPNTLILANTIMPYIQGSQAGSSELINIFIPNFINRSNNNILDVCGNMQISGDIRINDGGSLQSTNNTFSILDSSVQNIIIGSASKSIILGGISTGITELKHNMVVHGNATINGNLTVESNTNHIGNLQISNNSNIITSHIIPNTDGTITIGDNATQQYQINIGGYNDNITFYGRVIYEAPAVNNAKTIVVNANNPTQFASSGGSGFNIYDNKGLPPPYNPLNDAGYIHVGYDLQSFVFKAPNINSTGNPISGNNIVRLGVNSLTMQNPNIINGLVVLQKDQTYHNNQQTNGTSFGVYNSNESNYAIVSYNLDVSNIMLKQIDYITGSQVLDTNIIIGNSLYNKNLDIYGNVWTYNNLFINGFSNFVSDVSLNGNLVINRNTLIYGNITGLSDNSFNGNLRVGGNVSVNGFSNFVSDVSLNGNLVVNRNTLIYGNITSRFDSSFNGNLRVGGNIITTLLSNNSASNLNVVITSATNTVGGALSYDSDMWYNPSSNIFKVSNILVDRSDLTSGYVMDVCGALHIYEGNRTGDSSISGSLVIEHGNNGGVSSIIFPSKTNKSSDYGYIRYRDDVSNNVNGEQGRFEIGTENDIGPAGSTNDALILQKNGGFVGIGTNNPIYNLDVTGTVRTTGIMYLNSHLYMSNGSVLYGLNSDSTAEICFYPRWTDNVTYLNYGSAGFNIRNNSSITTMFMKNDGNVGIGTTSPVYKLDVASSESRFGTVIADALPNTAQIRVIYNSITPAFLIRNDGTNVYFMTTGTTTNSYTASYNSNYITFSLTSSTTNFPAQVSATSFNATSDYRIKENIIPLADISYNIDHLKPVKYFNTKLKDHDMGFIAHEVQEVFPFLVTGEKDGENMQSINYNGFIALLVKEIQDLKKEMNVLKEEVRELRLK